MGTQPYTFAIDSFTIRNTRSVHQDTDYVSASLVVGTSPPLSQSKAMGDLNNGTYSPGIAFNGIPVADDQNVVLTYAIVNSGHSNPSDVESGLKQAVSTLGSKAAQIAATVAAGAVGAEIGGSIGTAVVPIIGTALGALAGWLVTEIGSVLFANCDGPVAAGVHVFTGAQLRAQTSQGATLHSSDIHPGTDSAIGCGSNSNYVVNWSIQFHEFVFQGPIRDKWNTLGGQSGFLGAPQTDDTTCPDGRGHFVHFQNGSIYWTSQTGAFSVHGLIRDKWASLGWERCVFLGYPITDETGCPDGVGRFNHFQNGSIYWAPQTGAFSVHGLIRDKWASLGWERCTFLGYPITDETGCPDGVGRFNHFQNGSIYWAPQTGAFSVHGFIRDKWASLGWEKSSLGYPTSDEQDMPGGGGRMNQFQYGRIYWQQSKGAWAVASTSP